MREWFGTAQGMIEFRRCLVQALDIKTSQPSGEHFGFAHGLLVLSDPPLKVNNS